jgi:hypothetical protein
MDRLINDSRELYLKNHNLVDKILVWRGDASVVNQAIRNNNVSKLKYWGHWIVCFQEFDRIIAQIETTEQLIVNRGVNEDIYAHLNVGDIVETITYTSTSDPNVDPLYDKSGSFGSYHLKITLPPKTHCFYYSVIDEDDEYFSEYEIILPPGRMTYNGCVQGVYHLTWIDHQPIIPLLQRKNLIGQDIERELL